MQSKKFKDTLNEDAFDDIKCCPTYIMLVMYPEADEKFKELWENTTTCRSNSEQPLNSLNCNKCWAKFITYGVDKQNGLIYMSKDNDCHKSESNKIDIALVIDRIKEISFKERKTMVERALKLGEEFGEVSEAVLSYKDVAGCGYKKKTIDDVREEAIDVIIMGFSLLFLPDESMEENDMLKEFNRKLNKWESKMERDEIDNEVDK